MWQQALGRVIKNTKIMADHYLLELEAPQVAQTAEPGQFVHLLVSGTTDPLLRRPISIFGVDRDLGRISLAYRLVGRGTQLLAKRKQGESLDMLGPLGTGFSMPEEAGSRILLVGGGIGLAPLNYLAEQLVAKGHHVTLLAGLRTASQMPLLNYFPQGLNLVVATDDGSYGHHGLIVEVSEKYLEESQYDIIYTCGPEPMIELVANQAQVLEIACQVSLERTMACGVGACLGCTCVTKTAGKLNYSHVCVDGPVFWSKEVVFHG